MHALFTPRTLHKLILSQSAQLKEEYTSFISQIWFGSPFQLSDCEECEGIIVLYPQARMLQTFRIGHWKIITQLLFETVHSIIAFRESENRIKVQMTRVIFP